MPARKPQNRGGRGGNSSTSSKFSRFIQNKIQSSTSGARSSRQSATPAPSRASAPPAPSRQPATPAPVPIHLRVRIAESHNGTPFEDVDNRPGNNPLQAEADEDADALNEVVLAVDLRERGTVGCAYYVARDEKLYFMEDARLGGVETIEARKLFNYIEKPGLNFYSQITR
jgi:DNA mismatch repair protein MSH5